MPRNKDRTHRGKGRVVTLDTLDDPSVNPFRLPSDEDIFSLRDAERRRKKAGRERMKGLKIHEKTTQASRMATLQGLRDTAAQQEEELLKEYPPKRKDTTLAGASAVEDRVKELEDTAGFIAKKREMFLLEYALGVKREEMRKLEEEKQRREATLRERENMLEEDANRFDKFLKENDHKAVDAIRRAEKETKAKLEKLQDIKKLNSAIAQVQSETSKYQEHLEYCLQYKAFLNALTPPEWLAKHSKEDTMYFTHPHQLLEKFSELEERNLFLIQNTQETEEALEENKHKYKGMLASQSEEIRQLEHQIASLSESLEYEAEKEQWMEQIAQSGWLIRDASYVDMKENKMHSYREDEGIPKGIAAEDMYLQCLAKAIRNAYEACTGESSGTVTALNGLTAIENLIGSLIDKVESDLDEYKVRNVLIGNSKARRLHAREKNRAEKAEEQARRMARALERAKAPVKKKTGRRLKERSRPPQSKKREKEQDVMRKNVQEEEDRYFFE